MLRVSALILVIALCAWHAPAPDPRVLAAINAGTITPPPAGATVTPAALYPDGEFVCPMDPDVRAASAGSCPRCGMKLVEGIKDLVEYPVHLTTQPRVIRPAENAVLDFAIDDPRTLKPVRDFEVVHEKFFHLFVVSQDLTFFLHTHPERDANENFHLKMQFPKPGMYRVLSDFYPHGGTPQLITSTVMVPGAGFSLAAPKLEPDEAPQQGENARASLMMMPERPAAGEKAAMYFRVTPDDGIEPYLGAMAHMLAAGSDLIDMIHNHPFLATDASGGAYKELQFYMTFPRPGMYRVWIQFQRKGIVNTVAFNIPVEQSK